MARIRLGKIPSEVTPPSGQVSLYAKSDDNLYIKLESGLEFQILNSGTPGATGYSVEIIQISPAQALAKEIELLENNGVTKQERMNQELTALQDSLAQETDLTKQKTLQEEIAEKQKEINIYNAQKKATEQKTALDQKYAMDKYKMDVELFNAKKALDIATVIS